MTHRTSWASRVPRAALAAALLFWAVAARADLSLANRALEMGDFAGAFREAASDITTRPAEAHKLRGQAAMGLGKAKANGQAARHQFETAVSEFQRALSHQPADADLLLQTGEALDAADYSEQALLYMAKAVEAQSRDFQTLKAYLDLLQKLKLSDKYITALKKGIRRISHPVHRPVLLKRLSKAREGQKEWDKAANALEASYAGVSLNAKQLLKLGVLRRQAGQHERALKVLEKAKAADPKNDEIIFNLGEAYWDLGKKDSATQEYLKLIKSNLNLLEKIRFNSAKWREVQKNITTFWPHIPLEQLKHLIYAGLSLLLWSALAGAFLFLRRARHKTYQEKASQLKYSSRPARETGPKRNARARVRVADFRGRFAPWGKRSRR
jgi:tetratricopeptide (TPR) repeat protein